MNNTITLVSWAILIAFVLYVMASAQPSNLYTLSVLDTNSDTAIAACSKSGGIAGWLTAIEENGDFIGPSEVYCAVKVK